MRIPSKKLKAFAAFLLVAGGCFAVPPPERNWTLTFEDEFNTLDRTKWHVQDHLRRKGGWNYANNVSAENGKLVITTRKQDGRYTTGFLSTRNEEQANHLFAQKYGYFEVRMKADIVEGQWSAFWLMPEEIGGVDRTGNDGCEIDIVELSSTDGTVSFTMHFDGYGEDQQSRSARPYIGKMDEYYTYGLQWTPTKYTWYVDGRIVWEETDAEWISQVEQHILLTSEIDTSWGGNIQNAKLPCHTYVDYVRVYKDQGESGNLALPSPVYGQEIVVNGGFEAGTQGWASEQTSILGVASPKQGGAKALKVYDRTLNWDAPSQNILSGLQAAGNGNFAYSGWIYVPSGNAVGVFAFSFQKDGQPIYQNALRNIRTGEWTKISGMFYLPVTSLEDASVGFRTTDLQDYYIDELSLVPVTFDGAVE